MEANTGIDLLNAVASRPVRIVYVLVLMAIIVSLCYGFQYRANVGQYFFYYVGFSAIFVILLAFATFELLRSNGVTTRLSALHGWCGLIAMIAPFTLTLFFQSEMLAPMPWYVLSAIVGLLSLFLQWKWGSRTTTRFFALAAMALVALLIAKTEVWEKGDMLLLVEAADREFLAGKQPYRPYPEIYQFIGSKQPIEVNDLIGFASSYHFADTPMQYLPGIWLAYLPAVATGLDPRILNLVFLASLLFFFETLLPISQDRSIVLSLTFYPILLSPSFLGVAVAVVELHYWLFLLLAMLYVQKKRYLLASILFGLSLATRQGTLFLVAPLIAYLSLQLKWKEVVRYASAALGVYLLITVPYAVWWGDNWMFWKHLYFDLALLPGATGLRRDIGMANLLEWAGLAWAGLVIQFGIIVFATSCLVIRREHDFGWILSFLGVIYIWVIVFNSYSVRYVYYAGFLLVCAGMAITLGRVRDSGSPRALSTLRPED